MELNLREIDAVQAVNSDSQDEIKKLTDLELAMIGGGTGDVSFG